MFIDDIKKAKEKFKGTDNIDQINQWELDHRKAELILTLCEHPVMKEIINEIEDTLIGLDVDLLEQGVTNQEDIIKRLDLQNKKEIYTKFLNRFTDAKDNKESIERMVKENLEDNA